MSAFIVNKSHISAMLRAALTDRYGLSWGHNGERHTLTRHNAQEVGQMLLDENIESVGARYPQDNIVDLPGRIDAEWVLPFEFQPFKAVPTAVEALSITNCYIYQACEHEGWEKSEAKAFCDALKESSIHRLPGFDNAPWEWTETPNKKKSA